LIYFTHTRLMHLSEDSVQFCAEAGVDPLKRVCARLRTDAPRYSTWISSHDSAMQTVANARRREPQITALRRTATTQIHRAALVRHLRDNEVDSGDREQLLREYYGPLDIGCATLAEHRSYMRAVSSQLCVGDLLDLVGDRDGIDLLARYQKEYAFYLAMHCDRSLAIAEGRPYLLASLLPEVRSSVSQLRQQIVTQAITPPSRIFIRRASPVANEPLKR
jgi:hypothetical protein